MSFPFSPYLSQILMKLIEVLINLHVIKISIYLCNVILFLFGTINCTTKDQSQPVWTDFFHVVDWLGPVFKGPVAAPEYLNWSRSVVVASCLVLEKKTGLNRTFKHCLDQLDCQLELMWWPSDKHLAVWPPGLDQFHNLF